MAQPTARRKTRSERGHWVHGLFPDIPLKLQAVTMPYMFTRQPRYLHYPPVSLLAVIYCFPQD